MRPASSLFVLAFAFAFAGCSTPDPCAKDPTLCKDAGTPDGLGTCAGQCAPSLPAMQGWFPTVLLWTGMPNEMPPPCPAMHGGTSPGFVDTAPTVDCPACVCPPSNAPCLLPTMMSANQDACPGSSGAKPFNAPQLWDGACNSSGPVSLADSLTVSPPLLETGSARGCDAPALTPLSIKGATQAQLCAGVQPLDTGTCADPSQICAYPDTPGFATCVSNTNNDAPCPDGWSDRHVFYNSDYACRCSCGVPVGDSCSATVTVFEDGACSKPIGSVMISSDQPAACADVMPGSTFASKSATTPVYKSGTCTPTLTPLASLTICCLP